MKRFTHLTRPQLLLATSLFILAISNQRFFSTVLAIYPLQQNGLFIASLVITLFSLTAFVALLLSSVLPVRVVATLLLITAAMSSYFADQFGTVIDTTMLQNALQTDSSEAADLLTWGFAQRLILVGLIPAVFVWRCKLIKRPPLRELRWHGQTMLTCLAMVALMVGSFSSQYASFFREHKPVRYYANPLYPMYSVVKLSLDSSPGDTVNHLVVTTAPDATIPADHPGHELIIMVVGETARADRLSLNGYSRKTNPRLEQIPNIVSYSNVSACGTSTAVSVPCMFAERGRKTFDGKQAGYQENALDILARAGVSVLWRDNNSDSKGVATRVPYQDFKSPATNPVCDSECRDVGMLSGLQQYIDAQTGDILIVLHQMGNHGPAYFKRYPEEFEVFTPACRSAELAECSSVEINNAYDNAIRYTDHFLAEVITLLQANDARFETAMLYVSDHGESLGEKGLYLHGLPYFFAPEEQTHVPIVLWASDNSSINLASAMRQKNAAHSHDDVYASLLKAFEVESATIAGVTTLFDADIPDVATN